MNNVKILDCTLRDGGRVNGCEYPKGFLKRMIYVLSESGIDIVEVGFLRGNESVQSSSIRFFFTDIGSIVPYLPDNRKAVYVAFVDFGLYDFSGLSPFDGRSVDGIRLAFTKKDFDTKREQLVRDAKTVKEKGYKLFLQGINSLSYSDKQLLDVIDFANEIKPYGFGIVDTYGSMYIEDVRHYYQLIDHNLSGDIMIDFHSHNNFQLSFSFAQEVINLADGTRPVIIDATLYGMGKGAGNLNTELLADYLTRKKNYSYDMKKLLDIIDVDIYDLWNQYQWGYDPAYLMAGIYQTNPNNIIHMLNKYRLDNNDIKNILSELSDSENNNNSYAKIDEWYDKLKYKEYDDQNVIERLKSQIADKPVLVLCPGKTLSTYKTRIDEFIADNHPVVFSVCFVSDYESVPFFANKKRYFLFGYEGKTKAVVTSDIAMGNNNETVLSARRLKDRLTFGSSAIALLYLLSDIGVQNIAIAGMDGYSVKLTENYFDDSMIVLRTSDFVQQKNSNQQSAITEFVNTTSCQLQMLTPSRFFVNGGE